MHRFFLGPCLTDKNSISMKHGVLNFLSKIHDVSSAEMAKGLIPLAL